MGKIELKYFQALILGLLFCGLAYGASKDPGLTDSVVVQVRQLSDRCWNNREKDSRLAIELAYQGITIAKEYALKDELAQLYNYSGVIHLHYLHNPESSIPFFNNALNLALQLKDSVQIAYVYNNLGDAFYLTGNIALAGEYADKSLNIFRKLGHKRGMVYTYINLGLNDRAKEEYASSLDCFFRAIRIREQIGDSVGIASAYLEVARTLLKMDNKEEAMGYFKRSLGLHQNLDNKKYMAFSLLGIGDVHFKRAQYDSSLINYQKALALDEERDYPSGIVDCQIGIARVFGKKRKTEEGKKLLSDALENARIHGLSRKELEVLRAKGDFLKDIREYTEALDTYDEYIAVYDSIYSEMQYQTMHELKNRFQLSEEMNRINEDLKKKQRVQLYAFSTIFLLLVVLVVLIVLFRIKKKLNAKLKASNQVKDKVFSIISHDLINPFNALIGSTELLEWDLKEKNFEEAEKNRRTIHKTLLDTFKLLNNMLYWARFQQNKIVVSSFKFDLRPLLEEIRSLAENQALAKEILIENHVSSALFVEADKNLVRIVLTNLLSNAIKFTPEKGVIQLSAFIDNNYVKVRVKDNGVGVPKEKISQIFNATRMGSTTGTNQERGTGLGLVLSKEFVELQGGEIGVESEEGQGSVFYFTLPGAS